VKREIVNVILPIYDRLLPQRVPHSGIQWPEHMLNVKTEYFEVWKKGKKRFEGKDMADNWTSAEWVVFEYLGPRGMDMSFLRPGSMDDDEASTDNNREGAKSVVKNNKKAKIELSARVSTKDDENAKSRAAIALEMAAHTKMANRRLIMLFGTLKIGLKC
jgi:hypothetical protein